MKQLDIKEIERYYCILPNGEIYSLPRDGYRKAVLKLKHNTSKKTGYVSVMLQINGLIENWLVHRLVALSYIPNPENKPQVNHIDGDKSNNNLSNLEWVTRSENEKHAHANKLKIFGKDRHPSRKINSIIAKEIRELKGVLTQKQIGERYGISGSNVSRIQSGETW